MYRICKIENIRIYGAQSHKVLMEINPNKIITFEEMYDSSEEKKMQKEIERKFYISEFPTEMELIEQRTIYQSYVSIDKEVRVRETIYSEGGRAYHMAIKGDGDLIRDELEFEITKQRYDNILKIIDRKPIEKDYRIYKMPNEMLLECSSVDGGKMFYAEIEFDCEADANEFNCWGFLKEENETTGNDYYKMKNYWKRTRIDNLTF